MMEAKTPHPANKGPDKRTQRVECPEEKGAKPEVKVSDLPSLPPSNSLAWERDRSTRWKGIGCGCVVLILLLFGITTFFGLKETVWSSYEDLHGQLQEQILISVPSDKRQDLLTGLDAFDTMLHQQKDPYPLMGAFVRLGKRILNDWNIDTGETAELKDFFKRTLKSPEKVPE